MRPTSVLTARARPRAVVAALKVRALAWLGRPDVRVALGATGSLRLLSFLAAAAFPLLTPGLYPWREPFGADHFHLVDYAAGTSRPVYSLGDYLTQPWNRWDTAWYVDIAQHGYVTYGSTAYMPLYPALMRLLAPLLIDHLLVAGLVISTVATFVCFLGLYRLTERLVPGQNLGHIVILVCCLLPTSFFMMAAYTEALFLALATVAMLAALDRHWWHVALLGAAGALTRQQGVFLGALAVPAVATIVWQFTQRLTAERRDIRRALLSLAAPLAAMSVPVLTYAAWIGVLRFGLHRPLPWDVLVDPHTWNLHFSWPWQGLWVDARLLFFPGDALHQHGSMTASVPLDLIMSVSGLAALVMLARRLPPGMVLYLGAIWWSSLSKVSSTGLTVSESRYVLQLVPLCILPAAWLASGPGWRRLLWVALSLPFCLLLFWGFVLYLWVG